MIDENLTHRFLNSLESLKNSDSKIAYLEMIFTEKELKSLYQRFEIIQLLMERKTQREVCDITRAAPATVVRGANALRQYQNSLSNLSV